MEQGAGAKREHCGWILRMGERFGAGCGDCAQLWGRAIRRTFFKLFFDEIKRNGHSSTLKGFSDHSGLETR